MSGVGTMMVLASAPHTKQTAPELQLLNFVESIGKIGSYAERSSEPHTQLALRSGFSSYIVRLEGRYGHSDHCSASWQCRRD